MTDIEVKLHRVAAVIQQLDDSKVPRNIRKGAKDSVDLWLMNTDKQIDVRIAMAQNKLEELYDDPNMPSEFGTLILQITSELERLLTEVM